MIPDDVVIPENVPFFSIPVWDKYSKEFSKVTFRAPEPELSKNNKPEKV